MKNKTKHIAESMKFTVDISDSGKFTVNIQDCRNFTVNISDCQNYSINRQDCAGGVNTKKSVLSIDAPKSCVNCPFCSWLGACRIMKCLAKEKIASRYTVGHYIFEERKPGWCPIQDLPEEREVAFDDKSMWAERRRGYNACIEDILKEADC